MSNQYTDDTRRLLDTFDAHADRVLAYASRHVDAAAAQDVVSEVFLVAWRRIGDVPDEPLPWLLTVARNTIHNRTRSTARQRRLTERLAALESAAGTSPGADETVLERHAMVGALRELSDVEREALLLTAWDGLGAADAARVAGCSPHAFEVRLQRARSRLRRSYDGPGATSPTTTPAQSTPATPAGATASKTQELTL